MSMSRNIAVAVRAAWCMYTEWLWMSVRGIGMKRLLYLTRRPEWICN